MNYKIIETSDILYSTTRELYYLQLEMNAFTDKYRTIMLVNFHIVLPSYLDSIYSNL